MRISGPPPPPGKRARLPLQVPTNLKSKLKIPNLKFQTQSFCQILKFQTENSKIGFFDQNLTNPERSSASPYLSAGTAHSAGPSYFTGHSAPSLVFFWIFPDFGPIFLVSKNLEKTCSSWSPKNLKNQFLFCDCWSHFGRLFDPFWRPFAGKIQC